RSARLSVKATFALLSVRARAAVHDEDTRAASAATVDVEDAHAPAAATVRGRSAQDCDAMSCAKSTTGPCRFRMVAFDTIAELLQKILEFSHPTNM
ncbi:unnamed protein product, partial [Urochloa humidicola]